MLPQLVLRQEQFHTSEFMIEAIKRGIPGEGSAGDGGPAAARALEEAGGLPLRPRVRQRDRPRLAAMRQVGSLGAPGLASPCAPRSSHQRLLDQVPARRAERDRHRKNDEHVEHRAAREQPVPARPYDQRDVPEIEAV